MRPYKHQEELSAQALGILREHGWVYLAMEERTGKTLTAILAAEASSAQRVLVITKKKALDGWTDTLAAYPVFKKYTVTNYHQAKKLVREFDLVILDEAHNYISGYPKRSAIWKDVYNVVYGLPIIYLSATPHAQGPQQLFNQLALSAWSPWRRFVNFYKWFAAYGIPYTREINGIQINQYDRVKVDKIMADVQHCFISKTRQELGFEHEPEDKLHYIKLGDATRQVYNELVEHNIVELKAGMLVCDTKAKLRASLHMLEGGTAKIDDDYIVLGNKEKVNYIKEHFGDRSDLVIMYNYKAEKLKLEKEFQHALLLQATSFAEGVDLHEYSDLVIYSQDFSTARHNQRRARQANKKRSTPIVVHFLLVKGGLSSQVYKTVSINKKNFVDSVFERTKL